MEENKKELPDIGVEMHWSPDLEPNTIVFHTNHGVTEVLKFCENGDIYVKGKLVENDKEVVEGIREFLKSVNQTN